MSGTTAAVPSPRRRFKLDPQFIAPILITVILAAGELSFGVLESPLHTLLAIGAAIACEAALGWFFFKKVPHLASAYVTGISVGILIRSPFFWPFAVCSIISIMSKYVLRTRNRHIWNPSNFGVSMMLVLAPATVASLSIQWGNSVWPLIVVWILGSTIIYRLKRFHITATYVVSFVAFAYLRTLVAGDNFLAEVSPITGPMYQLFIFFMITDPKTTVKTRSGQMLVAFLVAAMECALRLWGGMANIAGYALQLDVHAPYFALFFVGPAALLIEIYRKSHAPPPLASVPQAS